MSKKELAKELVARAWCHGNWECGYPEDDGMYYDDSQLEDMDLRLDDKYIKTIFTTYDEEYAREWCK